MDDQTHAIAMYRAAVTMASAIGVMLAITMDAATQGMPPTQATPAP